MGRTTFYLLEQEQKKQDKGQIRTFTPNYEDMTKKELYQLAQKEDIPGRTKMDKSELIQALKEADK
jgi:hypothetical protein